MEKINYEAIFLNGFTSWHETHFEIVSAITGELNKKNPCEFITEISENQGTGGLYELAEDLTTEFELKFKGKEWDGEFFDEIENFINEKFK